MASAKDRNFLTLRTEYPPVNVFPFLDGPPRRVTGARFSPQNPRRIAMNIRNLKKAGLWRSGMMLAAMGFTCALAAAGQQERGILVLTSTNSTSGNAVAVFGLNTEGTPRFR